MDYIFQILFSFIATACFGVVFNAPTRVIPFCGFVGAIGWTVFYSVSELGISEIYATFLGAFAIALVAQIFARKFKMPMIIFNVSGIIPLVPGGIAYNTILNMMELDYILGVQNGMRALILSGAIAMGLVFAEVIVQLIVKIFNKRKTSMQSFVKSNYYKKR